MLFLLKSNYYLPQIITTGGNKRVCITCKDFKTRREKFRNQSELPSKTSTYIDVMHFLVEKGVQIACKASW